jgi:hypothetical protein
MNYSHASKCVRDVQLDDFAAELLQLRLSKNKRNHVSPDYSR